MSIHDLSLELKSTIFWEETLCSLVDYMGFLKEYTASIFTVER
jgi:hypothetical protein